MSSFMSGRHRRAVAALGASLMCTSLLGTIAADANTAPAQGTTAVATAVARNGTTRAAPATTRSVQTTSLRGPAPRVGDQLVNLPAEPLPRYLARKARTSGAKATAAPTAAQPRGGLQVAGEPTTVTKNIKGVDFAGAGSAFPPDTHGAVGKTQYLQIVNVRLRVLRKSDNALLRNTNLATFFGDSDFVFDPRALYDNTWNRFAVLATRKADSPTDTQRYYWLAVSRTASGSGAYHVYRVNFGFNPGDWCDFPQLGMDQDSLIVTCNMFHVNDAAGNSSFVGTYVVSIAKARLYNGAGFGVPNFTPGSFSIAPPLVTGQPMQQSDRSFLVAANSVSDVVHLWRMENTAHPAETSLVLQANVPVTPWSPPPLAFNGGGPLLDTLDGRFQNNSVQNGTSLWNVHSELIVRNGTSFSIPRFYEINTSTNAVVRTGVFFRSSSSDDWNASVGVSQGGEAFFTFSSAQADLFPQIRTEGCQVAVDGCSGDLGAGTLIQSSVAPSEHIDGSGRNRYGDYTAVSLDPSAYGSCLVARRAWITNQYTDAADRRWDSRIARIGFC